MIDAAIVRLLLEASLRVLVVAAAVGSVLTLARVKKGSIRHSAWTAVVITMLLMPVLVFVVPQFELPRAQQAITFLPAAADLPYIGDVNFDQRVGARPISPARDVTANYPDLPPQFGRVFVVDGTRPPVNNGFPLWLVAVVAIYAAGLLMLLVRWIRAARFLSRLRQASRAIEDTDAQYAGVFESPMAATPITVGSLHPWIVLPVEWRTWSKEKLAAVLAHERSHVRRHDPLIGLIAYVNRCIYWFNPLAWWLERQVAAAAEHAADEDGVKAIGKEQAYAEVLLDMAATVRKYGGRVAWQGVGVDGNGLLGNRIDRVLTGAFLQEVSPMKQRAILFLSILAIAAATACKQHVEVPPLKENPKVTAELNRLRVQSGQFDAIRTMTAAEAEALEAKVANDPGDISTRLQLLNFYRVRAPYILSQQRAIEGRRAHALWLIAHRPDDNETGSVRFEPSNGEGDPAGEAQATKLWLAQLARKDLPATGRLNGILFLQSVDLALAEKAALDAQKSDPSAPRWTRALANVYAQAVTGAYRRKYGAPEAPDPKRADEPYAVSVRARLEASSDAALLANTGRAVTRLARFSPDRNDQLTERFDALGRSYITRAVSLDPALPDVVEAAAYLRDVDIQRRVFSTTQSTQDLAERVEKIKALPEAERFPLLAWAADAAYINGESADYYRHDAAKAKASWDAAGHYASDLVSLAPKFKNDPDWSASVLRAHVVLGLVALRNSDVPQAVKEMKAATDVPGPLSRFGGQINQLATTLLTCGERETVAEFYERIAKLQGEGTQSTYYRDAAEAIRAGQMTAFMQNQLGYLEREKKWKAEMAANAAKKTTK